MKNVMMSRDDSEKEFKFSTLKQYRGDSDIKQGGSERKRASSNTHVKAGGPSSRKLKPPSLAKGQPQWQYKAMKNDPNYKDREEGDFYNYNE